MSVEFGESTGLKREAAEWMVQQCHAVQVSVPTVDQLLHDPMCRQITYRSLAARLHPGRQSGNESQFKTLTEMMERFGVPF